MVRFLDRVYKMLQDPVILGRILVCFVLGGISCGLIGFVAFLMILRG
jgi:hypothetical protein